GPYPRSGQRAAFPARRRQCEARALPQVRRTGGRRLPERYPRRPRRERASQARVREGLHPVRRDGGLDQGKPARGKVTAWTIKHSREERRSSSRRSTSRTSHSSLPPPRESSSRRTTVPTSTPISTSSTG